VKNVLHFRIFDSAGKMVVDTDEKQFPAKAGLSNDLRKQLQELQPPHELSPSEKRQVITAVTSITGHTPDQDAVGIFLLNVETGEKRQLTTPPPGHRADVLPAFSPDGRTLAFLRDRTYADKDIYLVPVSGGEPRPLTHDHLRIDGLAWTPDSRGIVFSSPRGGLPRLWRIAVTGGEPEALSGVGEQARDVAIALKGDRLAYVKAPVDNHIWRVERPGTPTERPRATRFAYSIGYEMSPHYSLDGRRVVFDSGRSGSQEIWVCDSDGLPPHQQLTTSGGPLVGSPNLSDDGLEVAFDARTSGESAIWVVGVEGGRPPRKLSKGPQDNRPSWSHDKQWVYFIRTQSGSRHIWKVSRQGEPEVRLTRKQGAVVSSESADGKWVYYTDMKDFWKISVDGGEESYVFKLPKQSIGWTVAEDGIYFLDQDSPPEVTIKFFDFASQQTTLITQLEKSPFEDIRGLAAAPNGKSFLYTKLSYPRDIMLVENFR
jgi:Tol biopolymer transport system component